MMLPGSNESLREAMEHGPVEVIAYSQDNKRELAKGTLLLIDNIVDQASAGSRRCSQTSTTSCGRVTSSMRGCS